MYYNDNERNVWYYNHLILLIYMTNKNFLTFSFKNYVVIKFVVLITIWLGQHNFFNEKVRKFLSVTYQQIMVARTKTFLSVTTRIHYRFCGQVLCTDCNYSRNFHVNIVKIIIPFGRREHSTRKICVCQFLHILQVSQNNDALYERISRYGLSRIKQQQSTFIINSHRPNWFGRCNCCRGKTR